MRSLKTFLRTLARRLATLAGLKLIRWGEQSKVCEAGEGVAIVRLDPGEWAIISARSYSEWKAPTPGHRSQNATTERVSRQN